MNNYTMVPLTIIAILLFSACLLFWSKKYGNLEFNQIVSMITLFFSCVMILLMIVTIQSGQKDTEKHIEVLKDEIARQIHNNQKDTKTQIEAIETATKHEIQEIKEIQNAKRKNRMAAYINELTLNIEMMDGIIQSADSLKDPTKYNYIPANFKTTTYYPPVSG